MDNKKTDYYYFSKIISDIDFCLKNVSLMTLGEFVQDETLSSAISFKFIQISENVSHLSEDFLKQHNLIDFHQLRGLRNKIVHDYVSVLLDIIYYTVIQGFPILKDQLIPS